MIEICLHLEEYIMIRKAFVMSVDAGCEKKYIERHNPIPEELEKTLKSHGVHNYSIYLDRETNSLFGYVEIESIDKWNKIAETESCRKWWQYMRDIMPANSDSSPVACDLEEVFHLD